MHKSTNISRNRRLTKLNFPKEAITELNSFYKNIKTGDHTPLYKQPTDFGFRLNFFNFDFPNWIIGILLFIERKMIIKKPTSESSYIHEELTKHTSFREIGNLFLPIDRKFFRNLYLRQDFKKNKLYVVLLRRTGGSLLFVFLWRGRKKNFIAHPGDRISSVPPGTIVIHSGLIEETEQNFMELQRIYEIRQKGEPILGV